MHWVAIRLKNGSRSLGQRCILLSIYLQKFYVFPRKESLPLTTNGIFLEKGDMINVMVLLLGDWPTWAAEVALAHGNLATMNRLPYHGNCARQPLLAKFLQETAR
jgi:hypothetical protein